MGKFTVEVETLEVKTETEEVITCEECGREVGNAGRKYFGVKASDLDDPEDRISREDLIVNEFLICGECDKKMP
jgi:hypothetical protein